MLGVFQDDVRNYGAVTERFNSYVKQAEAKGDAYFAIFKGVLLLNAFNNVSGANNNGLITPSEENIHFLFDGTRYANQIEEVLDWLNTDGIIQRAPGGLFSVQFTALPSVEIEEKKNEMRMIHYKITNKIIDFATEEAQKAVERMMQKVIRPFEYKFYSDVENESALRSQIKNGRKTTRDSRYFFALLVSRNNDELAKMRTFAEECAKDAADKDLENIIFVVMDAVFGDDNYERFIEYQANYACASSHGFVDQTAVHRAHSINMVKDWLEAMSQDNAIIYINGAKELHISMKHFSSTVNSNITTIIYPYGPDAHNMLREKASSTFWKVQNSKEMVRTFLFANSKDDFQNVMSQMRPIQHLLQDSLDENMEWKSDIPEGHPFKMLFDKVNGIIKHADKSLPFNLDEKFSVLTKPPYGLYSNFAAMGMMAFALRPWVNKIFDLQGKPRDAIALVGDIVLLFKVWEGGEKSKGKLDFKFQTPEEGKLCKELISLFGLNGVNSKYRDVTSLKDARYAITADFLGMRGTPLWALKYAQDSSFADQPEAVTMTDGMKRLVDNIVKICSERELRNPALINDTLQLIGDHRFDMKNVLKVHRAFSDGFNEFLIQIPLINVHVDEVEDVKQYVEQNLESSVGYWTEEEVREKARDWRLSKQQGEQAVSVVQGPPTKTINPINPHPSQDFEDISRKRNKAKTRIAEINDINDAKAILNRLCDKGNEWVLDVIND